MHMACRQGASLDVVKCLVAAAPDTITVPNKVGETPLDNARYSNNTKPKCLNGSIKPQAVSWMEDVVAGRIVPTPPEKIVADECNEETKQVAPSVADSTPSSE